MILFALMLSAACASDIVKVKVTDDVINHDYIGNGAEWDPYDEAISWGCDLSQDDWDVLTVRADVLGMGYVRCMINSPYLYWDAARNAYDRDRNIEKLCRILQYCQDHDITVIYGEFNPPDPSMKDSERWVEMSVDYLNHLVNGLGFDCIRHFVIFNEPDGDWAPIDGDLDMWISMARRFDAEMASYPGLKDKVSLAAPDVVVHWVHPRTGLDAADWIRRTAEEIDDLVGIYDVHAYPGQAEVRDGSYAEKLRRLRSVVPEGKKMILGEAGFKYDNPEDSLLLKENLRRADEHPYAGGADSNMMVYDHFYGLDMSLLAMDAMNSGFSGMAVWMLDDAAHSVGDSGNPQDIKVWGFWNILGKEVFGNEAEEEVRPWFQAWALMCRYFKKGCDILSIEGDFAEGLRMCAAVKDGRYTFAAVNWSDHERKIAVEFPAEIRHGRCYVYEEGRPYFGPDGLPAVYEDHVDGDRVTLSAPARSLILLTDME